MQVLFTVAGKLYENNQDFVSEMSRLRKYVDNEFAS